LTNRVRITKNGQTLSITPFTGHDLPASSLCTPYHCVLMCFEFYLPRALPTGLSFTDLFTVMWCYKLLVFMVIRIGVVYWYHCVYIGALY